MRRSSRLCASRTMQDIRPSFSIASPIQSCDAWLREFAAMLAELQVESLALILNNVDTYVAWPKVIR